MAAQKVISKKFVNWEFKPPEGVRIIHTNGYGHVRFHIEEGRERDLLVALQEFITTSSIAYSESRKAQSEESASLVNTKGQEGPEVA